MSKRTKRWTAPLFVVALSGSIGFVGCSESATSSGATSNQESSAVAKPSAVIGTAMPDPFAANAVKQKVVGAWLGEAFIDTAAFQAQLQTVPAARREELLSLAEDFLTTVVAVDFRADGTLEQEIEVTPTGSEPLRDGGAGTWRVVEVAGDEVELELKTQLVDGKSITDQHKYRFDRSGNQIAQIIDLGPEFASCNPLIVLRRQQLPETKIAEQIDTGTDSTTR